MVKLKRSDPNYYREYHKKNRKTQMARVNLWRQANPLRVREYGWKSQGINLTYSQFEFELKKQKGKCKICGERMKHPQVDHDHKTGSFRGLLCMPCNMGLGVYEKNRKSFKKYLEIK